MKSFKYTCPYCGKVGDFGNHFCGGEEPPPKPQAEIKLTGKYTYWNPILTALVATGVILGFLWSFLGSRALFALGLIPLIYLGMTGIKKIAPGDKTPGYAELFFMTGQDKSLTQRLIRFELKKSPGLSKKEAIQDALNRLKYERSR